MCVCFLRLYIYVVCALRAFSVRGIVNAQLVSVAIVTLRAETGEKRKSSSCRWTTMQIELILLRPVIMASLHHLLQHLLSSDLLPHCTHFLCVMVLVWVSWQGVRHRAARVCACGCGPVGARGACRPLSCSTSCVTGRGICHRTHSVRQQRDSQQCESMPASLPAAFEHSRIHRAGGRATWARASS